VGEAATGRGRRGVLTTTRAPALLALRHVFFFFLLFIFFLIFDSIC
jgi:hypothetical protein